MSDFIEIVCGTDSNYIPHLGAMLRSLLKANPRENLRLHVLHDQVASDLRQKLQSCAPKMEIRWYGVAGHRALSFPPMRGTSTATYLRLTMCEFLPPEVKRAIYLDADLIVNAPLRPLWETDLIDKPCGAIIDAWLGPDEFASKYELPPGGFYFNAGVMLLDLQIIREEGLFRRAIALLGEKAQYPQFDQDVLNIALWKRWTQIDPVWNFQRGFLYHEFSAWHRLNPPKRSSPAIVHYTEKCKPWQRREWHPYAWLYIKNLLQTPFYADVLKNGQINWLIIAKWRIRMLVNKPVIFRWKEFRLRDYLPFFRFFKKAARASLMQAVQR